MTGDLDPLAAFRRMLQADTTEMAGTDAGNVVDDLVDRESGRVLRQCAVPHEFESSLLQYLGGYSDEEARARYQQFAELSIMQIGVGGLSMHERWRKQLWRWWLSEERRSDFMALSGRLADWFKSVDERQYMFHLFGARPDEGLHCFEALFRRARRQFRPAECALLLQLAHEYDAILSKASLDRLAYQDAVLAADSGEWQRALDILQPLAEDEHCAPCLRVDAEIRLASVLQRLNQAPKAVRMLEGARVRLDREGWKMPGEGRLLHELADLYRDLGDLERADDLLQHAFSGVHDADSDIAGMWNSLGTVQHKLGELDSAITSFNNSLAEMLKQGDALRSGAVYNNLGLAQKDNFQWAAAEESLKVSLAANRAAGNKTGEATTLLNLSSVQSALERLDLALESARQAATLAETIPETRLRLKAQAAVGRLLRRAGKSDEALAVFQKVVAEAQHAGELRMAAEANIDLAHAKNDLIPRAPLKARIGLAVAILAILVAIASVLLSVG